MSHLQPVRSDYEPEYPRELTGEQIQDLLRPGLLKRFSQQTIATGALIAGMAASGCSPASGGTAVEVEKDKAADDKPDARASQARRQGPTTSKDPNLRKKVDAIVAEVLGKTKKGFWYEHSYLGPAKELKTNPPVKYPIIPISYGNSCIGIFDQATAREATHRLFESFGIKLKKNVSLKGDGYEFQADGFNEDEGIGFELILPQGRAGFGPDIFEKEKDDAYLSKEEKTSLNKAVASGAVDMLVIDAQRFPNMDGDLYTPMEYYLASVVDYLNWVHGDNQIDPSTVLGKLPGRTGIQKQQVEAWQKKYATIPGGSFEDEEDLKNWTANDVVVTRSSTFSGNLTAWRVASSSTGSHSLQLQFETGGRVRYTVPEGARVTLPSGPIEFVGRAYNSYPTPAPLKITLTGTDGSTWEIGQSITQMTDIVAKRDKAPFRELKSIELTMDGDATYMIWLDDLGFTRAQQP